ncbi:3-hydroxyacyl-CoA dehydrogenase [Rubrobacter taiwanensis]|uniref:3-hydroxyacyl-CoA dehydrogenase n=2 Tax=Rubrobacter taiwanensis TaxID=185139 RepID=A0A4R1BCP7_9ACTN|nr:3-hydroxyacyl-CoA dehydrogenase [Rubrobacter taiwanensis]
MRRVLMPDLAVVGAGTMGAGIAEAAALAGLSVVMVDREEAVLERGRARIERDLNRRVEKGRISESDRDAALERVRSGTDLDLCADAPFVIEAVFEDLDVKREVFSQLDREAPRDVVLATNTSSLSVARIAAATERPERVVGMHFFNPVPALKLVEVVAGPLTAPEVVRKTSSLAERLGKVPVVTADTPGFIVNRVARPFYLEGLRLLEAGGEPAQIDAALEGAGFRMGPFRLMDLIGVDINLATSESMYERSYGLPRYRPSHLQRSMVEAGLLGRKTGRGFYEYEGGEETAEEPGTFDPGRFFLTGDDELAAALGVKTGRGEVEIRALRDEETLAATGAPVGIRRFSNASTAVELAGNADRATRREIRALVRAAGLTPAWVPDLPAGAALRTVAALANEAAFALAEGVASAEDIDRAMQLGVNYPKGPLAWADELGAERILRVLDALRALHGDAYAAAPLLRNRAAGGKPLSR